MKKVLILAYDFPPLISIGGQRPYSWLRYLPEFGFRVTVVTRHWTEAINSPTDYIMPTQQEVGTEVIHEGKVVRVPFKPNLRDRLMIMHGLTRFNFFRKALSVFYSCAEHVCFALDAKSSIYYEAVSELANSKYDLIIATGEPFILFRYAHKLSEKFNVPWVADYRDCWTSNQQKQKMGIARKLLNNFFAKKERTYLSNVSLITTPSPDYAEKIKDVNTRVSVEVVYNGYDNDVLEAIEEQPVNRNVFTISYAGTLYPHQNIEMFLEGVRKFVADNDFREKQFKINLYGIKGQKSALERIGFYPDLQSYISLFDKVPYATLMKELKKSNVLLLLTSPGMKWLNAKVFDYLAVRKRILLVENDGGILEELVLENHAGFVADSERDVESFLADRYQQFLSGEVEGLPWTENHLNYSRKKQAEALARLLKSIS